MIYITKGFHLLLTIIIIQNSFGHWAKQFGGDEIYPFHSSGKFDLFLNHQLKTIYWRVKRVRFNLDECKRNILSHKTQVRKAVQIPNELALFYDNYTFLKRCHNQQILHLRHFLLQTNFTFNVIIQYRPFVHKGIKGNTLSVGSEPVSRTPPRPAFVRNVSQKVCAPILNQSYISETSFQSPN